jgi:hypothetical protein
LEAIRDLGWNPLFSERHPTERVVLEGVRHERIRPAAAYDAAACSGLNGFAATRGRKYAGTKFGDLKSGKYS